MTWLTAVLVFFTLIFLWISKKSKRSKAQNLAKKSNTDIKKNLEGHYPDYQPAELRSVKGVDHAFYGETEAAMSLEGFSSKGDFQDLDHSKKFPKQKTVLRFMVSKDRKVMAAFYHLPVQRLNKMLLWLSGNLSSFRTIDLESEFSDGYFVMTTTAALLLSAPPGGRRNLMPESTSVGDLVRFHNEAVEEYQEKHPDVDAIVFNSFSDIVESQARGAELSRRHRENLGGLTKEELANLMPSHMNVTDPTMANELKAAFDNERNSAVESDKRGSPFEN